MWFVEVDRAFVRGFDPTRDREAFEEEWARRAAGGNAEVQAFAPHYCGSSIVVGGEPGPPGAVGTHDFRALPGRHLPPCVDDGGPPLIETVSSFERTLYSVPRPRAR